MSDQTNWVETTVTTNSAEMGWRDSRTAFRRLFDYIQGANIDKKKIPMTVPVLTQVQDLNNGQFAMTMKFYLGSGATLPPTPTNTDAVIFSLPQGSRFYVRTFRKYLWANKADYVNNLASLKASIGDPALYDDTMHIRAGYESPFFMGQRRYEVWLAA